MASRTLLLVGSRFEPWIEQLDGALYDLVIVEDSLGAFHAMGECDPAVVVIHADELGRTLRLLREMASELQRDALPILVILDPRDEIAADEVVRQGASDCVRIGNGTSELAERVGLLCKIRELAETVMQQRSMIERHVESVLQARDEVVAVRAELEALLENGPLVMYSAEVPVEMGAFSTVDELECASFTYLDRTVFTLLGYPAEELVGEGSAEIWRRVVLTRDHACLRSRAHCLFERGQHACQYRMRHADGRVRWISDEARVLRSREGAAVAVMGCLRDVTREHAAAGVVGRNAGLLHRAQRMQGAQRLAGTVAHDFNNLLAVIMCHAQYASKLLPDDHAAQKSLSCMLEASMRAKAGTKLLVQLSKRDARKVARVNVNALVRETVKLIEPLLGGTIHVGLELRPKLPRVRIDRLELEHALLNLCVNARDAMPLGGTLTVRTDVSRPTSGQEGESGASVVIEVADTGFGMDDRVIKRVFEPFFTTKAEGEGTGLGLYSVLQTVRQNGGAVAVETEAGQGTTLRILLPALEPHVTLSASEGPESGTRALHPPAAAAPAAKTPSGAAKKASRRRESTPKRRRTAVT